MIQTIEARELCSDTEWALVESSFSPAVEALPPADLKSALGRVRKLHRNSTDLVDRQHSDARKQLTRRKTTLFAEAIGRFEAALTRITNVPDVAGVSEMFDREKPTKETRALELDAAQERAARELESSKSHVLSALAVRGELQGGKSGAKRIQSHVGSATRRQQSRRETKNS